jgi:hypothetical protein
VAKLFIAGHWSPAGKFTTLYCGPDAAKAETLYKGCEELGEARLYVNPMPSRARKNKPPRQEATPEPPETPPVPPEAPPAEPETPPAEPETPPAEPEPAAEREWPRARSHHKK